MNAQAFYYSLIHFLSKKILFEDFNNNYSTTDLIRRDGNSDFSKYCVK